MNHTSRICALAACSLLAIGKPARANGLEAPGTASARHLATGAAAASSTDQADAVVINPAGLAGLDGLGVVLNAMPIFNRMRAPLTGPDSESTASATIPLGDLAIGWSPRPGVGLSLAVSSSGGTGGDYGTIDYGDWARDPEISQTLGAAEVSLGAGVRVTPYLSVGAAWRITKLFGDIRTAAPGPMGTMLAMHIADLSGENYAGFRLGAQLHSADRSSGLGLTVRTPVTWQIAGTADANVLTPDADLGNMPMGPAQTELVFPLQVALGAHASPLPGGRVFAQYSFSQYSKNASQTLSIGEQALTSQLDWHDRHAVHLGYEHRVLGVLKARAGYIFESSVTNEDRPNIYAPPGANHSVTLGAGMNVLPDLSLDAALLYNRAGADSTPAQDTNMAPGRYGMSAVGASLSVSYRVF